MLMGISPHASKGDGEHSRVAVKLSLQEIADAKYPAFTASLPEWRTVISAIEQYKEHLARTAANLESEDEQLVTYDHMERLERIIPSAPSGS